MCLMSVGYLSLWSAKWVTFAVLREIVMYNIRPYADFYWKQNLAKMYVLNAVNIFSLNHQTCQNILC